MEDNPTTVFITGSGRSGTNITKAIFARHSQCGALPFEYRFTVDPGGIVDFYNQYSSTWSPFMVDRRLKALEHFLLSLASRNESEYAASNWLKKVDPKAERVTQYAYAGWELEEWFPGYGKYVSTLIAELVEYKYEAIWPGSDSLSSSKTMYFGGPKSKDQLIEPISRFLASCFGSFLQKVDKSVFVEDNTWSFLFARDLMDLVPNGKIIHITRDPRDVLASLLQQRWTPSHLDQILPWYKSIMSTWNDQKSLLKPTDYLEVALEDIISKPKSTIAEMCSFCGLEWEEEMSRIDLSKANSGRYKNEFTAKEISKIESVLGMYGAILH